MNNKIINILSAHPEMQKLNTKASELKDLSEKVEAATEQEGKLELLEEYVYEFNSFLGECVDFYNNSITNLNNYMTTTITVKEHTIKELQNSVDKLTKQLIDEQYKHEKFLETLCSLVQSEPEKAIGFLNNLQLEKSKQKKYLC